MNMLGVGVRMRVSACLMNILRVGVGVGVSACLMHVLGAAPSLQRERMNFARQQQNQIRSILKSTGVGVGPKY